MNPQQLVDLIIKPTLIYMGDKYHSKNATMLLLATAAIESDCGYYIKQVKGPALGIWQMEPATHSDIWRNCDALKGENFSLDIGYLGCGINDTAEEDLITSPRYACAMARLKYAMDPLALPDYNDIHAIYDYYKRIYNTVHGASTFQKFNMAWSKHRLNEVVL